MRAARHHRNSVERIAETNNQNKSTPSLTHTSTHTLTILKVYLAMMEIKWPKLRDNGIHIFS